MLLGSDNKRGDGERRTRVRTGGHTAGPTGARAQLGRVEPIQPTLVPGVVPGASRAEYR